MPKAFGIGFKKYLLPSLAAILVVAAGIAEAEVKNPSARPGVFGTIAIRSSNLKPFPKWRGALDRYFKEEKFVNRPCTSTLFNPCQLKEWKAFLKGLEGKDRRVQLERINKEMNYKRYILDIINYRVVDYWATPLQFFSKDGDCEDYAITKYMSLRTLGVPAEDMRIVVLQDMNLRLAHAVLVVYLNDEAFVLDNQIRWVVKETTIRHYRPYYSVNESNWWLHRQT